MSAFYTDGQRAAQEQFETTKMADLLEQVIVHPEVQDAERAFIESRDMFFLATVDDRGQPTCSYKGGDPGFVKVITPRTLLFPVYDGNGMYLSLGNIATSARVGMLFIDFETPHRLRVQGIASVERDAALLRKYPGAEAVVRVAVSEIFVNCSRYVHRYQRVAASRYVPRAGCETPFAEWKRIDVVQGALPPNDAGRTERAGGTITIEEYEARLAAGQA
ncbi:MAG TPA: pyridoxamine 5'-phosphate oxidase family protein [Gemmatimonadales bacterium]|nr:pyridoxamine 5'-phosphate oxidase family protein [Gemmatimonadales bacterium]